MPSRPCSGKVPRAKKGVARRGARPLEVLGADHRRDRSARLGLRRLQSPRLLVVEVLIQGRAGAGEVQDVLLEPGGGDVHVDHRGLGA